MSRINDDKIVQGLKNIKNIYSKILVIDLFFEETFLLTCLKEITDDEQMKSKIEEILSTYKTDFPHDSSLIKELNQSLKDKISTHPFDTTKFNYSIVFKLIEKEFEPLFDLTSNKQDKFILNQLKNHCESVFTRNPNMQGVNPYYKTHLDMLCHCKELDKEYLDKAFDSFIDYFSEDE